MCSDICIHSVPLLAGFCVSTRRILDRVFCFRVLQARQKPLALDCVPIDAVVSRGQVQAHACHRVWSAQLIPGADGAPSSQESQMALISTGGPGVAALHTQYIGGPGSGQAPLKGTGKPFRRSQSGL